MKKIFSEVKKSCTTKAQKKAFNRLLRSFKQDKSDMYDYLEYDLRSELEDLGITFDSEDGSEGPAEFTAFATKEFIKYFNKSIADGDSEQISYTIVFSQNTLHYKGPGSKEFDSLFDTRKSKKVVSTKLGDVYYREVNTPMDNYENEYVFTWKDGSGEIFCLCSIGALFEVARGGTLTNESGESVKLDNY